MEKARETFSKYDIDKDGKVSSVELKENLMKILADICSPEEAETRAKEVLSIVDADGDGHITFIEFIKGFDAWMQVEEAASDRKLLTTEYEKVKKELLASITRRKQVEDEVSRQREKVDWLRAKYSELYAKRLKLERDIGDSMNQKKDQPPHPIQSQLREDYNELDLLQLVGLPSKEFYANLQAYLSIVTFPNEIKIT